MILDRLTTILVASLCLAGCAASPSLTPDYVGRYPGFESGRDSYLPAGAPLASLPAAAGNVLSVRDTRFSNGLRQEIVLEGPHAMTGENKIVVEALTPPIAGVAPGNDLRLASPSDTEIQFELAKVFPDVAMEVSSDVEHGSQGPFGYASGKNGRLNCLYAWEYLAPQRPLSLLEGASGTGVYPASVRVRLCRAEPLADMLTDMHRLIVTPPGTIGVSARATQTPELAREDALEAAVGPLERLPVAETPVAAGRSRQHLRSARTNDRQRAHQRRRRDPERGIPVLGRSTVPPVPLPGDLAPSAAAAPPAATSLAARSSGATPPRLDQDSMPLPK